ncbi:UNVERIFIED_CONTAM: prefoldin subunit 5 [Brevibacillus sp. OAP136]
MEKDPLHEVLQEIRALRTDVSDLKAGQERLETRVGNIDTRLVNLETGQSRLEVRQGNLEVDQRTFLPFWSGSIKKLTGKMMK